MKRWKVLLCFSLAAFLFNDCQFTPSGGGTEGEGLSGQLVDPQGMPVGGASVRVYDFENGSGLPKLADETGTPLDSTLSDAEGRYRFSSLADGHYNLEASIEKENVAQVVFVSGILLRGNFNLGADTLRAVGSILIKAVTDGVPLEGVQCYIPGSSLLAISDDSGICRIANVPPGIFQIRLRYEGLLTVTSNDLTVQSGMTTNAGTLTMVADPELPPPQPRGVSAKYDKVAHVVTVTWKSVKVEDLAGYAIYCREDLFSTPERMNPNKLVVDTVFKDSLFKDTSACGRNPGSIPDTLLYQVKAQDWNGNLSPQYSDPAKVTTR